jgi:hypothetical protein
MKQVKLSEIFRKAAKIIEEKIIEEDFSYSYNWGCCNAINDAVYNLDTPFYEHHALKEDAAKFFRQLFKPSHKTSFDFWFGDPNIGTSKQIKERQGRRVIALLLAAEYVESIGE